MAEGHAQGLAEGIGQGQLHTKAKIIGQMLQARGVDLSPRRLIDTPGFAAATEATLLKAASACTNADDFAKQLRQA